ncbi:MAG: long-chain fatty acid--CoA ligase [Chloroflexi bacterium]|nr:long-chain fatty acid--CoA ligase [Chloroflexota bacterium]
MERRPWHESRWPEGVPFELHIPLIPVQRLLEDAAKTHPDHPFILFNDAVRTYRQMNEMADQVAGFLSAQGIGKGDRVALFLPNLPHFPAAFFGILKAGAICVPCNPTYTVPELHAQLADSGARGLIVMDHPTLYAAACEAMRDTAIETVVTCNAGDFLPLAQRLVGGLLGKIPHAEHHDAGHVPFSDILHSRLSAPPVAIDPHQDTALLQYTGGTTGVPKGTRISHHNIVSNLLAIQAWIHPEDEHGHAGDMIVGGECFIGALPWFHAYGLIMTLLAAVRLASSVVCVPDPRAGTPPFTEILRLVQRHRATVLNGVPTLFSALIHHPDVNRYHLDTLKLCGCGAAPLAVELAQQFEAKTGAVLYEGYGMTETTAAVMCNPTSRRARKLGSLGLPLPDTDAVVLDSDTGLHLLPQGEVGEIAVSGPQLMLGYWNSHDANSHDDATITRIIGGRRYLLTGDIGHMDEDGFFWLSDRKKDIVIIGGYKAYPREIEEVLYAHPKVAQAAVVGVEHERMGQVLKAFIRLKDGSTATSREIIDYCKERLAGYKVPRLIEFRDSLPTSAAGKVLKRELR